MKLVGLSLLAVLVLAYLVAPKCPACGHKNSMNEGWGRWVCRLCHASGGFFNLKPYIDNPGIGCVCQCRKAHP